MYSISYNLILTRNTTKREYNFITLKSINSVLQGNVNKNIYNQPAKWRALLAYLSVCGQGYKENKIWPYSALVHNLKIPSAIFPVIQLPDKNGTWDTASHFTSSKTSLNYIKGTFIFLNIFFNYNV